MKKIKAEIRKNNIIGSQLLRGLSHFIKEAISAYKETIDQEKALFLYLRQKGIIKNNDESPTVKDSFQALVDCNNELGMMNKENILRMHKEGRNCMSDGFRTDYRSIMKKNKKTFSEVYEGAIDQYAKIFNVSSDLRKKLKAKREFGLTKYKDLSFQSNFDNAISTPVLLHLKEELVDSFNYSLHHLFQLYVQGCPTHIKDSMEVVIQELIFVYERIILIEESELRERKRK